MHITQNNTPSFRKDINGLRAIAVIAVIFYHFSVSGFGGGFVGVDIFFVISGFLMTRIITERLAAKTFSLTGFYLARAKNRPSPYCTVRHPAAGRLVFFAACGAQRAGLTSKIEPAVHVQSALHV
ncbi:acyltransferase [Pseudomonas sp. MAFF212428]|uniref:Acyltransferase n=1 Tax=Pseudomonas brassicae TaxID=2708063 RepID=A0A6M0CXI2_9PSED|nr:acyltransferase [Pseudomonas brassicae]